MKGSASRLVEFLEGSSKRFIIPVYQRNYDWKKENCKQLFDDLVQLIKCRKENHFFGSIVSAAHGRNEIILIDGQQRITSVSLIMIALINALKKGVVVAEDSQLATRINETYIIDKYRHDARKVRLKPFRDDCDAFDALVEKEEADYKENSTVTINYRYFYDRIVNQKELTPDELFEALENLMVIDIELEPEHGDDPQLIFESLNSTGLDLTESDKIRNYILMGLDTDRQETYYDNYWNKIEKNCNFDVDSFIRNYLTIKTGLIPNIHRIYISFKEYAVNISNIEDLLYDMLQYAQAYKHITTGDYLVPEAKQIINRLQLLDKSVTHPFLMAFFIYGQTLKVDKLTSEVVSVLTTIESYIFRRLMCDLPTNALNKVFSTLHRTVLKNKKETDLYSSVLIYYLESRKLSSAFPKDEDFIQGFTTKNIYAMRSYNKAYLFERLENNYSNEINDVVQNIENGTLSIEHIMPQTLNSAWKSALGEQYEVIHEKWLHTIANLTLTGYNTQYSNHSFADKKTMKNGFEQSGLRLNQYIAKFDKWTEEELIKRKDALAEMALELWQYPTTAFVPVQREDDMVSLAEDNSVTTNRKIIYFVFKDTKYVVADWAEMMWEVGYILLNINPVILYNEAKDENNVWFSTTELSKNYHKLCDGIYFCNSNSSTWNKMSILKRLFKLYDLEEDDLTFALRSIDKDDDIID